MLKTWVFMLSLSRDYWYILTAKVWTGKWQFFRRAPPGLLFPNTFLLFQINSVKITLLSVWLHLGTTPSIRDSFRVHQRKYACRLDICHLNYFYESLHHFHLSDTSHQTHTREQRQLSKSTASWRQVCRFPNRLPCSIDNFTAGWLYKAYPSLDISRSNHFFRVNVKYEKLQIILPCSINRPTASWQCEGYSSPFELELRIRVRVKDHSFIMNNQT